MFSWYICNVSFSLTLSCPRPTFTLSNARRFYSWKGDPLGSKGLSGMPVNCDCCTKNANLFCLLSGYSSFDICITILILNYSCNCQLQIKPNFGFCNTQWKRFRSYITGSAFVIYGRSVLELHVILVIYFICKTYGNVSVLYFIIWLCLTRTRNYQIYESIGWNRYWPQSRFSHLDL